MTIYVGNVSQTTTEADVEEAFKLYGEVTSVVIKTYRWRKLPGRFALVRMPAPDDAGCAIRNLNDKPLGGQNILVREHYPTVRWLGRLTTVFTLSLSVLILSSYTGCWIARWFHGLDPKELWGLPLTISKGPIP